MSTKLYNKDVDLKEITIAEFDAMDGEHVFSKEYEQKKQSMLDAFKSQSLKKQKNKVKRVAVAAAAALIVIPATVYAASTHTQFFDNMFGNSTKKNMESYDQEIENGSGDGTVTVTVPSKEYVSVDSETAETLIGEQISDEPIVKQLGDHTLTIESVVYDKHAAMVSFTLEREGGVTMLDGDALTNQTKGAYFSNEAEYFFGVFGEKNGDGGNGCIYIDFERSTSEKLYCYQYVLLGTLQEDEGIVLNITHFPSTMESLNNMTEEELSAFEEKTTEESVQLSNKEKVSAVEFVSEEGGYLEVSPISLVVDMAKGLGLSYSPDGEEYSEASDPIWMKKMELQYKDGSSYLVEDQDNYVDNTGYVCQFDTLYRVAFNRLVDTEEIECIMVNGVKYTRK